MQDAYADNAWSCPALLTGQNTCGSALIMVAPGNGRDQLLIQRKTARRICDIALLLLIVSLSSLSSCVRRADRLSTLHLPVSLKFLER